MRDAALASTGMRIPGIAILSAAALATVVPFAAAAADKTPPIPATVDAKSPFTADRDSSEPLGLTPDQVSDPFTYPDEPVVLEWSPVPGAVSYVVEISTSPGFTRVVWRATTDQWKVAPQTLLPDGTYWWRVTAVDAAGTKGITSEVATFAKNWPSRITGGVLSATPGGAATSLIRITPYLRWNKVAGARSYDTQIAPADQFATPSFSSINFPVTAMSPAEVGVLPDDAYQWRVRATDPAKNPGPWVTMPQFTKAWVAPVPVLPADGATTDTFMLKWDPVAGAEKYLVQVTRVAHNFTETDMAINAETANNAFIPSLEEVQAQSIGAGTYHWRVRPIVDGIYGTWSDEQSFTLAAPASTTATPVLTPSGNSDTALMPHLLWSSVTGATIYRVDIATDFQFNNIVESAITKSPGWVPRTPLRDNQVNEGYYWRVVAGSGASASNPHWMYAENTAPTLSFTKQTRVTLGSAATGVISEPPLFTWSEVPGAAKFELQLSRDEEFDSARTQSLTVWATGTEWAKDQGKRLPSGTWYWRVRAIDSAENGLTWSPVQSFTLNPPRPDIAEPADGDVVVGSPLVRWATVNAACAYQVQFADNPSFQANGETPTVETPDANLTPGAPSAETQVPQGAVSTPQVAVVPSGDVISKPGTWYWRVRADFCDSDYGPWTPTRKFRSVRPPQFNLNRIGNSALFGSRLVVAGKLVHNGRAVRNPRLIVERRLPGEAGYSAYGTVSGDAAGRFAFSLRQRRTAAWRIRWAKTADHPEGLAPFAVRVVPRVSFNLSSSRVERRRTVTVRGSVYPATKAYVQVRESSGWTNLATVPGTKQRFRVKVRANLEPGGQQLRLYVPAGDDRKLDETASAKRNLYVYDRFVVR